MWRGALAATVPEPGSEQVVPAAPAVERTLAEVLELLQGDAELPEDLVEERRPDLSATMDGNRHGPAIGMVPSFVAACLADKNISK